MLELDFEVHGIQFGVLAQTQIDNFGHFWPEIGEVELLGDVDQLVAYNLLVGELP